MRKHIHKKPATKKEGEQKMKFMTKEQKELLERKIQQMEILRNMLVIQKENNPVLIEDIDAQIVKFQTGINMARKFIDENYQEKGF